MAKLGRFVQTEAERKRYTVDYTDWLDTGETVSTLALSLTPVTSTVLVANGGAIEPGSLVVSLFIGGGLDGSRYTVTVTITTSAGQTKKDHILIEVNNP